jgi:hypothetical protein
LTKLALCLLFVPKDWLFRAANLFLFFFGFVTCLSAQDSLPMRPPFILPAETVQPEPVRHSVLVNDSLANYFSNSSVPAKEPAFYAPHELAVRKIQPNIRPSRQKEWAFIILFICILLLAWTRYYFKKRLRQVFQAFLSARYYNQLVRAGDVYNERISVNLFLIFILAIPLLFFEINYRYPFIPIPDSPFGNLLLYGFFLLVSLILYGLKMLALHISGQIFKTYELTSEYVLTHYVFNLVEGIMLIPLLILLVFNGSAVFLLLSLSILAGAFLYRLVRGLLIGFKEARYSVVYMLTFFISIEILPILVLLKLSQIIRME